MESFYGGRQGASFIIVKHFDGIDIPQDTGSYVYRVKIYAINEDGYFILDSDGKFIERNNNNYNNYAWKSQVLDGSSVEVITAGGIPSMKTVDRVLAEGMRQCFEQGGDTADIVNYGEYVIIDTIIGMSNTDHPDNGKVYRRGLNYNYDSNTNPLAGAEYIGQIVGPQGKTGAYEIETENEVKELEDAQSRSYTIQNGSLIPGKYTDQSGADVFNDDITYSWGTIKDTNNNLIKSVFGFTIPYSVQSFIGQSVNPYYNRTNGTADFENIDLIEEIPTPDHPFFQQWQVNIPKGKKGDSLNNLEVYPTYVRGGTPYWDNQELSGDPVGLLSDTTPVIDYSKEDGYLKIQVDENTIGYCDGHAAWKTRVRYKETVYDRVAEGDSRYIDIGDYNTITGVSLTNNGKLTVTYSYNDNDEMAETLKWLYYKENESASGIELKNDGSIIVHYNTGEVQNYPNWLTWITGVSLDQNGDFEITYNNNALGSASYTNHLQWINRISIDNLGNVVFYNNDGTIAHSYPGYLKSISNVTIDTGVEEGSGTQKINIEYNTAPGVKVPIGKPINYIIESVITDEAVIVEKGYTCQAFHLLVLYADPEKRAAIGTETYWSTVLNKSMAGWHDLGYVRGVPGGLHIITNIDDASELTSPPEELFNNPEYVGWAVTVDNSDLYVYDYVQEIWYSIGSISSSSIDASQIITISDTQPEQINNNGVWAVQTTMKYAN